MLYVKQCDDVILFSNCNCVCGRNRGVPTHASKSRARESADVFVLSCVFLFLRVEWFGLAIGYCVTDMIGGQRNRNRKTQTVETFLQLTPQPLDDATTDGLVKCQKRSNLNIFLLRLSVCKDGITNYYHVYCVI